MAVSNPVWEAMQRGVTGAELERVIEEARRGQAEIVRNVSRENVMPIDQARARRLSNILVKDSEEFHEPQEILLDIGAQNPAELLRNYRAKQAKYVTAPFDPHGEKLKFFPGGYSLWSGFPGAGKSTLLRQSICHWLNTNNGVFVASLEEHPTALLIRLAGTAFGCEEPTEQQLQWFCDFYGDQLRIWSVIGVANHRKILSTIQTLARKGVTQCVIDSLMKLDVDNEKVGPQKNFANLLFAVCQQTNVHVHLVAHPKKAQSNEQDVHLNDVGGAKEIPAGADNILFTRRGSENDFGEVCGMKISIRKQRHGSGMHGDITGWFNRRLRQFKFDQFDQVPTQYLPKQAYA